MSDREDYVFEEVGELEAFNTDGLAFIDLYNGTYPGYERKNITIPRPYRLIIALQQAGFFDTTPLRFDEVDIPHLNLLRDY